MKLNNKKSTSIFIILIIALIPTIVTPVQPSSACSASSFTITANISTDNAVTSQTAHYTETTTNTGTSNIIFVNVTIPKGYSNLVSSSLKVTNSPTGQTWTPTIISQPTLTSNGTITLHGSGEGLSTNQVVSITFTLQNPSVAGQYQWITSAYQNSWQGYQKYSVVFKQLINSAPTPTPDPTVTPTPSPIATSPPTPVASPTPQPTVTPTQEPTPTASPTPTPTSSDPSAPTVTPTPSPIPTSSDSPTPTPSQAPTLTDSPTPTPTPSSTETVNPSPTATPTPTSTQTSTPITLAETPTTYTITFKEQGLPAGKLWNVIFNGQTKTSTTSTITFSGVQAGDYTWTINSIISENATTRYAVNGINSMKIQVPTVTTQNIAYITQYYLTINSPYGNPIGEGWYNAGSTAIFRVDPQSTSSSGTQYAFGSWTGTGKGSYNGTENKQSLTMNNAITETATWEQTTTLYTVAGSALIIFALILIAALLLATRRRRKNKKDAATPTSKN